MTLKEADEAARMALPVIFDGHKYKRITQIGYKYDYKNVRREYIQLLDKNGNSVVDADPKHCTATTDFKNEQTGKEQTHEPNNKRNTP